MSWVMCRMSWVMCRLSCVACHDSCVACHESCVACHESCVACHDSCVACPESCVACHKIFKALKRFCIVGHDLQGGGWGGEGETSNFGALFRSFNHARLFKSAGIKFSVQRNSTLAKANKKIYYAVLSHFAKFPYLLLRNCLKKRGKGVQPNRAMPIFWPFFLSLLKWLPLAEEGVLTSGKISQSNKIFLNYESIMGLKNQTESGMSL